MFIDIYCHIYPDRFFQEMQKVSPKLGNIGARLRGVTKLFDLDARFREMDEFGDYREIISLPNPPIEDLAEGQTAEALARVGNDAMAELCAQHPQRFPGFAAAVALTDVDAAIAEAHRAIRDLGARGVQIFTNIAGRPLDLPEFRPFFAAMAEHDLPIWLHPARTADMTDYAAEQKSRYEMWWCFGWPYETSVAMSRLVFSGLFDRHPGIKIITHHLGGMIPFYDGRVGPGLDVLGARTSDEDYSKVLLLAQAAAPRLFPRVLRRYGAVRRQVWAGLRPRLLRRRSRGVRDRYAARPDPPDHRGDRPPAACARGARQDHVRQRRAPAQDEIQLAGRALRQSAFSIQ